VIGFHHDPRPAVPRVLYRKAKLMWNRKTKRVSVDLINAWETAAIIEEEKRLRPRPNSIDEFLALSVSERNGAILQSALITDLCESIVALRSLLDNQDNI
jgi:hypothetical protein